MREASNRLSAQPIIHHKSCQICSCYPCLLPVFTDKYGAGRLFRVLHTLDHRCLQSSMCSSNLAHFFALTTNLAITRQHSVWSTAAFRCTSTALHTAHCRVQMYLYSLYTARCRVQMYLHRTAYGPLLRANARTSPAPSPTPRPPLYDSSPGGQPLGCQHSIEWAGRSSGKSGDVHNPVSSRAAWRASW